MTPISNMTMDLSDIRRMATGSDTPAGYSLIEANMSEMTTDHLCMVAPVTRGQAEQLIALRDAVKTAEDWESVPAVDGADFEACNEIYQALPAALHQIIHAACERIVDAIGEAE